MHTITVQDQVLTYKVESHDTSITGIRWKLVVTLPKRLPSRRIRKYPYNTVLDTQKPRKDLIAPWVLDIGNALWKQLEFEYGLNPDVTFSKGQTHFTYFFNSVYTAKALGYEFREHEFDMQLSHENRMRKEQCPAFQRPYL